MTPTFTPLTERGDFAARVDGIDLREPLADATVRALDDGMARYAVLVFGNQQLSNEQQIAFSRRFGQLEPFYGVPGDSTQRGRVPDEINDISNLDRNNRVLERTDRQRLYSLGNLLWHSDSSYKAIPAKYSLLSARVIPDRGGDTEFADMRAAWDGLDADTRALTRDMIAEHSRLFSRALLGFEFDATEARKFAPVRQRLVRTHPATGRQSLFLSSHAGAIVGMPIPEARALLRELTEHATQPRYVYTHQWRQHDLVVWDNRVTMHRGRRYPADQPRDLRRTTLIDDAPTIEQIEQAA